MGSTLKYFAIGLFAFAFLAGCVAKDLNSPRPVGQVHSESKSEASRSKSSNYTNPPNITYRPDA
jgi:hypothetical protein